MAFCCPSLHRACRKGRGRHVCSGALGKGRIWPITKGRGQGAKQGPLPPSRPGLLVGPRTPWILGSDQGPGSGHPAGKEELGGRNGGFPLAPVCCACRGLLPEAGAPTSSLCRSSAGPLLLDPLLQLHLLQEAFGGLPGQGCGVFSQDGPQMTRLLSLSRTT